MKSTSALCAYQIVILLLLSSSGAFAQVRSPGLAGCAPPAGILGYGPTLDAHARYPFRMLPVARVEPVPDEFVAIHRSPDFDVAVLVPRWITVASDTWFPPLRPSKEQLQARVYIFAIYEGLDASSYLVRARIERDGEAVPSVDHIRPTIAVEDGRNIIYGLMSVPCDAFYPGATVRFVGEQNSGETVLKTFSAEELALISGLEPNHDR